MFTPSCGRTQLQDRASETGRLLSSDEAETRARGRVTATAWLVGEAKVHMSGGLFRADCEGAGRVVGVVIVRELGAPA